jgi:hypothetical protein
MALPPDQREQVKHHLEEITVVLIKRMISDQMDFVSRAKQFLEPERESEVEMTPRIPNPAFTITHPVKPH